MQFAKTLALELIPALLAALVAGMGAYVAVKGDITGLSVNQEVIIQNQRETKDITKDIIEEQHKQGVRIALVEQKIRSK